MMQSFVKGIAMLLIKGHDVMMQSSVEGITTKLIRGHNAMMHSSVKGITTKLIRGHDVMMQSFVKESQQAQHDAIICIRNHTRHGGRVRCLVVTASCR